MARSLRGTPKAPDPEFRRSIENGLKEELSASLKTLCQRVRCYSTQHVSGHVLVGAAAQTYEPGTRAASAPGRQPTAAGTEYGGGAEEPAPLRTQGANGGQTSGPWPLSPLISDRAAGRKASAKAHCKWLPASCKTTTTAKGLL
jgi:hypothetical protein